MKFEKVLESLFVRTLGHRYEIHTEKRSEFSDKALNKKNKSTAPKVQKKDIHIKDYEKTLKSGGDKQYTVWLNNTVSKI